MAWGDLPAAKLPVISQSGAIGQHSDKNCLLYLCILLYPACCMQVRKESDYKMLPLDLPSGLLGSLILVCWYRGSKVLVL